MTNDTRGNHHDAHKHGLYVFYVDGHAAFVLDERMYTEKAQIQAELREAHEVLQVSRSATRVEMRHVHPGDVVGMKLPSWQQFRAVLSSLPEPDSMDLVIALDETAPGSDDVYRLTPLPERAAAGGPQSVPSVLPTFAETLSIRHRRAAKYLRALQHAADAAGCVTELVSKHELYGVALYVQARDELLAVWCRAPQQAKREPWLIWRGSTFKAWLAPAGDTVRAASTIARYFDLSQAAVNDSEANSDD